MTDPNTALLHRVEMDPVDTADRSGTESQKISGDTKTFVSDTGQLRWDVSIEDAGYFSADTPRTKLFTGFVRERWFPLGNIALRIGKTGKESSCTP